MFVFTVVLIETILLIFAIIFFIFLALPLVFFGAPFLPSYRQRKREILKPLFELAKQTNGKKFIDLGSGDGRVVIEFAKQGFESWGVEFNPALVLWSRLAIKKAGLKNAHIIRKNFWKIDLSQFDVVYIFQLTSVNALLADKFKKELKPGALIISAGFILPNFNLVKKEGIFLIYKN